MTKKIKKPSKKYVGTPDRYKAPQKTGFLYDAHSGDVKLFGRGRKSDRNLDSLESKEDKDLAKLLNKAVAAGVRFAQQEQTYKKLEHPPWQRPSTPTPSKKRKK
jgi:hypothetical protein